MVILRSEAENAQRPSVVFVHMFPICFPKQPGNGELAALDPDTCCLVDALKRHQSTIRTGHESVGIIGVLDWPSIGFKFPGRG